MALLKSILKAGTASFTVLSSAENFHLLTTLVPAMVEEPQAGSS